MRTSIADPVFADPVSETPKYDWTTGAPDNGLTCFHASFFPFCPFCWPPLCLPFLGAFSPFFSSRKVLFPVERKAQHRAWGGAVSGWKSSGRKFLPEICVKKVRWKYTEEIRRRRSLVLTCAPLFYTYLRPPVLYLVYSVETEGLLAFQGRVGITCIVRNLRLVIFGVELWPPPEK